MKILVVGGGGREHALTWKLRQSPRVTEIFCAPGNAGTAALATNIPIGALEIEKLVRFAVENDIALTVVGPDDALALGLVDQLRAAGRRAFGPTQSAARLESSKSFAKQFMLRHGIPTARSEEFTDSLDAHAWCRSATYPLVIKADGLALGKGVIIAENPEMAARTIYQMMDRRIFGAAGDKIVVEEFLQGTECSLHALVDGQSWLWFPDCQDHKRIGEGDTGPNTGGMGTISPSGLLDAPLQQQIAGEILDRFVAGLAAEGLAFSGMLFPGLMLTDQGPKVLEFNCRFGDPETQVLMRRLESDLLDLLEATLDGRLDQTTASWSPEAATCVILASEGYPGPYPKGRPIEGLEKAAQLPEVEVFHAGTACDNKGQFCTAGGRVLGVTARGADLAAARIRAYDAVEAISFAGKTYRRDIGGPILDGGPA